MPKRKLLRKIASVTVAFSTTLWLSGAVMVLPAAAQSIQDLLNQIAALQAQLAALQAGAGVGVKCSFTRSLTVGSRGDDVKCLQQYLNSTADKVAASGAGSPGNETTYFGSLTRAAVAKWQAANAVSPAVGYFGPLSRAKYDSLVVAPSPSPSPVVTPGVSPSPSPVPAGALQVALAPDNPAGTTLVADTTSGDGAQAVAPILKLRFTAAAGSAVKVTQVRLHRIGISRDADFSNAYLYDGATRLLESPSVSGGYFTFTNSAGLFEVPGGGSKDISFQVDLANGTGSGLTASFGILASTDVVSNAPSVVLSAFHGNEFRTATVSDLGKLTLDAVSPAAANNVDAGLVGHELWRWTAKADDQRVDLSYLKVSMIGTADYDALQNLKLFVDGVQVGATVALMASAKTAVFDLSASPVAIGSGLTKTVALRGDVLKGSGRDYYFQLSSSADVVAKDMGYGVFIKVNPDLASVPDVWSIFKAAGKTTINEGSLTVTKATASPTGPLALNATALEVARYDVKAVGEAIKISKITIITDDDDTIGSGFTNLKNLKATVGGVQVGTTVSTAATDGAGSDFSAGNTFVVQPGTTVQLLVFVDMASASGAADPLVALDKFTIKLSIAAADVTRMSSGTSFTTAPASSLAANAIEVTSGGLTATKNASVGNVSTVVGATNVTIASWLITAPSDQGVNVNSITVEDNVNTEGLGAAFDVFKLMSGGTQFGQTINAPAAAVGTDLVFSFSSPLNVPAGQSKQVDLAANVLSSASTTQWTGGSADAARIIATTGISATGVVTNSAVTYGSGNIAGQLLTINAGATLTVSEEVSPTMPDSQYLVSGDLGLTVAAYKFEANNTEDIRVNRVELREIHGDDKPGNVKNLKLFVDGVQKGPTVPAFTDTATNTALFEDIANGLFDVPKNTSKTVLVRVDMTPNTDAVFAVDANGLQFRIAVNTGTVSSLSNVSAKGLTSGALVTAAVGANCAFTSPTDNCDSQAFKVTKTKPTFALVSPSSTTLIPGEVEVFRFRITAHAAEDVKFVSGTHNIRLTQTSSPSAATAFNFKLFDAATNQQLGPTIATAAASGATSTNFTLVDITVPKGTTKEFYVWTTLTGFSAVGNSFKVAIKNLLDDLSWSDSTASADIEEDNFVGIGLPLEGATFVKP